MNFQPPFLLISPAISCGRVLNELVKGNAGVLIKSDTDYASLFPDGQFRIPGFAASFSRDRLENGVDIIVFTYKKAKSKLL